MKTLLRLGVPFVGLSLLACADAAPRSIPISSTAAALTAAENTDRSLLGALDAVDFLADSNLAAALDSMARDEQSCSTSGAACPPGAADCPEPVTVCDFDEPTNGPEELRGELRDAADELSRALRGRILIPENLESESETASTYRLGPNLLCEPDPDPDCVAEAERLSLRLRLTSPREGDIDLALLVGTGRHSPLGIELYRDSLGLRLDLQAALAAARDVGEAPADVEELDGILQLRLVRHAELDYGFEINVLERLSVTARNDAGERVRGSLAASSPTFELRADGSARSLTSVLDMATLQVLGPLSAFANLFETGDADYAGDAVPGGAPALPPIEPEPRERPVYRGAIELLLSGLSGTFSYTGATDILRLDNLGLGDATSVISHDGNPLVSLDLNADAGRRLELLIESLEDSGARVTFAPSLDLRLRFALHHIQDQFADLSGFLLDDVLGISLGGDSPAVELRDGQTQVVSGSLQLTSATTPAANVTVPTGMCLLDDGAGEGGSRHEWLGELSAGSCY